MDHDFPRVNGSFRNSESHKWRDPKSPCSPDSPQSPPSLVVRGKTLSLTKPEKLKTIKKCRKTRLQQTQGGNLSLKRRETSPDVYRLDPRLKPKRGKCEVRIPRKLRARHDHLQPSVCSR